jgi:hypothetical protein
MAIADLVAVTLASVASLIYFTEPRPQGVPVGLRPTQGDEEWRDTTLLACPSFTVQQVQLTAPAGRGSEKQLISP